MIFRVAAINVLIVNLWAFNISPSVKIIRDPQGDPDSNFGYTVALQKSPARLIVGAPRAYNPTLGRWQRPGAVFECPGSSDYFCQLIEFVEPVGLNQNEIKDYSWIGGALDVSDTGPTMAVCGPLRRRAFPSNYLVNGMCYVVDSWGSQKLLPLDDLEKQGTGPNNSYYYYAYGGAGLSVHFTPSQELIIGAPGVMVWTGTLIKYSRGNNFQRPIIPNPEHSYSLGFQWYGYTGYAVTSGMFLPNHRFYVTSAPRGNDCRGQVFVMKFPNDTESRFDVRAKFGGTQMGEYFGSSLAATDIDGDGLDDLLVGSPLFSANSSGDMGAVYVYRSHQIWDNSPPLMLFGHNVTGARFGSSIGALADLDQDGFNDVAIGAPYEDHGVVYIYRGSVAGLSPRPSQKIAASTIGANLRGFGISISRGVDIDGNLYPDLAVGAYDSGHVILLKTRPVVRLHTRIGRSFRRIETKSAKQLLFEICLIYSGKLVPRQLEARTEFKVDELQHRAIVMDTNKLTFRLQAGATMCKSQLVLLRPNDTWLDGGLLGAMPVSVQATLIVPAIGHMPSPDSNLTDRFSVQIVPTCDKEECVPSWLLGAQFVNVSGPKGSFVLGSAESVWLRVSVRNNGDSAFLRGLVVELPTETPMKTVPPLCQWQTAFNYTCLSAFRINSGQEVALDLHLDFSMLQDVKIIQVNITTQSYDSEESSTKSAYLNVVRVSRVGMLSRSTPEEAVLPVRGPRRPPAVTLVHAYEVFCAGYSPVPFVRLSVTLPKRMSVEGKWHNLLSKVSFKAALGDDAVNCTLSVEAQSQTKAEEKSISSRLGECRHSVAVECITAVCVAGPLKPHLHTIYLAVRMDLNISAIDLIIDETHSLQVKSSAMAEVMGDAQAVTTGAAGTLLAAPKLVREQPLLPLYIGIAVCVAIALLAICSYALWKCGFFKRWEGPNAEEVHLGSGDPNPESDGVEGDETM